MPFVTNDHRKNPDPTVPGDRCYVWYKWMIETWKNTPRWTTADQIYAVVMHDDESLAEQRAKELAWQVLFIKHIIKYENEKETENGTI